MSGHGGGSYLQGVFDGERRCNEVEQGGPFRGLKNPMVHTSIDNGNSLGQSPIGVGRGQCVNFCCDSNINESRTRLQISVSSESHKLCKEGKEAKFGCLLNIRNDNITFRQLSKILEARSKGFFFPIMCESSYGK